MDENERNLHYISNTVRNTRFLLIAIAVVVLINICLTITLFTKLVDVTDTNKELVTKLENINKEYKTLLENQNKIITERLDVQTELFHRIIGEALPVVVPEEFDEKISALKEGLEEIRYSDSKENLQKLKEDYLSFIKITPPWIQEQLNYDLLQAKYDIDYFTIVGDFNNGEKSLDDTLALLQNFIMTSSNYEYKKDAINFYNNLVDESDKFYEQNINELKEKLTSMLQRKDSSYEELADLYSLAEPYSTEIEIEEDFITLGDYLNEASLLNDVLNEADNLKKQIIATKADEIKEELIPQYYQTLSQYSYAASNVTHLDNKIAMEKINECVNLVKKEENKYLKAQEEKLLNEIKRGIKNCSESINLLNGDSISVASLNLYATELANYKYTAKTLEIVDVSEVLKEIDNAILLLDKKQESLSSSISEKENTAQKNYNRDTLALVDKTNKILDEMKGNKESKNLTRINCLLDLDKIQQNYLFTPVSILYQTLYQDIFSEMDSESKHQFTQKSVLTKKRELYERF